MDALGIGGLLLCGCVYPIVGVAFGLAQWRLLREPKRDLGLWLLANAIGWAAGLFVGSLLWGVLVGFFISGQLMVIIATPLAGGLAGIISGSVTGWALRRVLKN